MNKYNHEREVIGCLLSDPDKCLYSCQKVGLEARHFETTMRRAYESILEIALEKRSVVNAIDVANKSHLSLDDLNKCYNDVITTTSCGYHATEVKKAWQGREAMLQASKLIESIKQGDDADKVTEEFFQSMSKVKSSDVVTVTKLKDHKESKLEQWRKAKEHGFVGIPSSFPSINRYLGGWRNCLGIIGAYRGTGKSTLICNEALWQAKKKYKVAIFSIEDPDDIVASRIIGNHADVSTFNMDTGLFPESSYDKMSDAWNEIGDLPLWIIRRARTIQQIMSTATMLKQTHGLDIIYIDHLQLIYPLQLPEMNRTNTISTYTAQLADMAINLGCPVVCASQFSRNCEQESRKPRLSDLRDSGSCEQDARQILLLYETQEGFQLKVAKNNYGISNKEVSVKRIDGCQRFEETEEVV